MKNTEVVQNDWKAIADLLKRIKQYMSEHPDAIILVESHKRRTPQDDDALKSVKFVHKTAGMKLKFSKTPIRMERDGQRGFKIVNTDNVQVELLRKKAKLTPPKRKGTAE